MLVVVDEPAGESHRVSEFAVALDFLFGVADVLDGPPAFAAVNESYDNKNP